MSPRQSTSLYDALDLFFSDHVSSTYLNPQTSFELDAIYLNRAFRAQRAF